MKTIIVAIAQALDVKPDLIKDIKVLKKGMTNKSFLFSYCEKKYIFRIPGEGTDKLINRSEEAAVYKCLEGYDISDKVVHINPDSGYKITEYIEGGRTCNSHNEEDVKKCMDRLKTLHNLELNVSHEFDIFKSIEFYEGLRKGRTSAYQDYCKTKKEVFSLREYINDHIEKKVLAHIDSVPDNFLISFEDGKERIRLIDWEYAGMQDPHVDIAMFCIYSLYNRDEVDNLLKIYFGGIARSRFNELKIKIYCYIAACGLLWSNWCEYKSLYGVTFGNYGIRQYQFAEEYCRIVKDLLE